MTITNYKEYKMRQTRIGTFETNSSSTHTLVIMTKKEYDKFKKGELFLGKDRPLTKEQIAEQNRELIEKYNNGDVDEYIAEENLSYDSFSDTENEEFYKEYTTPSGEKIVAFGNYGYNG